MTGGHLVNDQHEDEAQHQSHPYQVLGRVLLLFMVTMRGCGSTVILVMVTSLVSHVQGLDTLGDDDREGGPQQQPRPQHTHQLQEVTLRVTSVLRLSTKYIVQYSTVQYYRTIFDSHLQLLLRECYKQRNAASQVAAKQHHPAEDDQLE